VQLRGVEAVCVLAAGSVCVTVTRNYVVCVVGCLCRVEVDAWGAGCRLVGTCAASRASMLCLWSCVLRLGEATWTEHMQFHLLYRVVAAACHLGLHAGCIALCLQQVIL
jgi:hypothetical protein